jgi:hypothetical protein
MQPCNNQSSCDAKYSGCCPLTPAKSKSVGLESFSANVR